jgi:hypothetical protein
MNIRPWLIGAVSVAAVTIGFSTGASATTTTAHHTVSRVAPPKGFYAIKNLHLSPLTSGTQYNLNSAGYAAIGDKNVLLRYAAIDFNVPTINCAESPSGTDGVAAYQLAGLAGPDSFINTGVLAICTNGTPTYQGYYELNPSDGPVFSNVTVSPGDALQASVYYNYTTGQYNIVLNDESLSTPSVVNVTAGCPSGESCENEGAEAITDVAGDGPPDFNLADYAQVSFSGGAVTARDGVKGTYAASKLWSSLPLGIEDSSGVHMAVPSSGGGSAFNTTWLSAS